MRIKQRVNIKLIDDKNVNENDETDDVESSRIVSIVFKSLILDLLAFTMILPLLPALLDYYKEVDDEKGLYMWILRKIQSIQVYLDAPEKFSSVLFGGFLGSMYSFLQFLSMPIIGALSDVYGRRPLMILCLSGLTLSYIIWAFSQNFAIFVLSRFIGGISKGNINLSMAIITDVTTPKTRGKSMALIGIAFSIGFIVGPMIGVIFSRLAGNEKEGYWYICPAVFALVIALSDLLYIIYCLKETLPLHRRAKSLTCGISGAMVYINPIDLFQFNGVTELSHAEFNSLRTLGRSYFLYLFIYSGLEFTLTFLTHHTFHFTSIQQSYMFLVIGLTMAILQGRFVRRIPAGRTKFFSELGLWLVIPAFIFIGFAESISCLYFGIFIFSVSTAMAVTCMMTLVTKIGPENQKGIITGIFRSLGSLARACGPIVASIAYWSIGSATTYLIGAFVLILPPLILKDVFSN